FSEVVDGKEVVLRLDPAATSCPALAEDDQDGIPCIDVLAGIDLVVRPGSEPIAKELLDTLVTVVNRRSRHPTCRGVPNHVWIKVLTPFVAIALLEEASELLDDLDVLLRHRPRSIPRGTGSSQMQASKSPAPGPAFYCLFFSGAVVLRCAAVAARTTE